MTTFDPEEIRESIQFPPRILIYGFPGTGKTTFASCFPDPIFLDLERGIMPRDDKKIMTYVPNGISSIAKANTHHVMYTQVVSFLSYLAVADHNYKTLVIDSLDRLEEIITDDTLDTNGWRYVNEPGFGKGQDAVFRSYKIILELIDKINQRGMAIIAIAHAGTVKIEHPVLPSYDKIGLQINKKAAAWFIENSDIIGYCDIKVYVSAEKSGGIIAKNKAVSAGERVLLTGPQPTLETKNRMFAKLPEEIPLSYAEFIQYATN
jgi:hypothetical protein